MGFIENLKRKRGKMEIFIILLTTLTVWVIISLLIGTELALTLLTNADKFRIELKALLPNLKTTITWIEKNTCLRYYIVLALAILYIPIKTIAIVPIFGVFFIVTILAHIVVVLMYIINILLTPVKWLICKDNIK